MPRNKRLNTANLPQLIRLSGHNGSAAFRSARDYEFFVLLMAEFAIDLSCEVHTFALLPNRVAILCTPRLTGGVGSFVQALGRSYVPYFNQRYARSGTLWNGRYRAAAIEPGAMLLNAQRFVDTLPARERNADDASLAGVWTGHQQAGHAAVRQFIKHHRSYLDLGSDPVARHRRYARLCTTPLEQRLVQELEQAVACGLAAGSDTFKDALARRFGIRTKAGRPGRPRIAIGRPENACRAPS